MAFYDLARLFVIDPISLFAQGSKAVVLILYAFCNWLDAYKLNFGAFDAVPALRGKDYGKTKMRYPDYSETGSGLQYKVINFNMHYIITFQWFLINY